MSCTVGSLGNPIFFRIPGPETTRVHQFGFNSMNSKSVSASSKFGQEQQDAVAAGGHFSSSSSRAPPAPPPEPADRQPRESRERHSFGLSRALSCDGQKHIWDNISGDALAALNYYLEYKEAWI